MATKLRVFQGDTALYQMTLTDQEGAAVNLTGALIVFSVVQQFGDTTYLIQKTSEDAEEININDPTNGKFQVSLTASDTELTPGYYPYDIEVTLASGQKQTVEQDYLIITQDVT